MGGRISGPITVNIEETGCRPIIIGELYGGGNQAAYSVYGYKQVTTGEGDAAVTSWQPRTSAADSGTGPAEAYANPAVNVKSFTSIGDIYGGGYGATAVMVGNPQVSVNVVTGDQTNHAEAAIATEGTITIGENGSARTVTYPTHEKGKIGAINRIFGGGNAAEVIGTPHVMIGTAESVGYVTKASGETTARTGIMPVGADIRGNVYGGGNNADVTGNTRVEIGSKAEH